MDIKLKSYLEENKIWYNVYPHPAVFTVKESKSIKEKIPGAHTKCLFLKDESNSFYLVALPAEKRLDIKSLKTKLNLKELHFASPEELKKELHLTPGSVSIFGMIYSLSVFLIIDKALWSSALVGFHPNINTSTLVLDHKNLVKFYNSISARKEVIEL